jgi:hypothetical protein
MGSAREEIVTDFSFSDFDYTAFEKWDYKPIIYEQPHEQPWVDFGESFYRASRVLVDGRGPEPGFYEDIEGVAAIFLFRHYLELTLKRIVVRGRCLMRIDKNAAWEDVKRVANIHTLCTLWDMVLEDARPKFAPGDWDNYDTAFVEACVKEFGTRDAKGFAFRYPQQGGERYRYDFEWFRVAIEHVYQVLEGIKSYLIESHAQNAEFDAILRDEAGF